MEIAEIRSKIDQIDEQMTELLGPADEAGRGSGRAKKETKAAGS